jgi:hypothetical protein
LFPTSLCGVLIFTEGTPPFLPSVLRPPSSRLTNLRLAKHSVTKLSLTKLSLTKLSLTKLSLTKLSLTKLSLTKLSLTKLSLTKLRLTKLSLTKLSLTKLSLRKLCSKPRKIRDSRRVSMLRSAQNLVKYVIRGVFQYPWKPIYRKIHSSLCLGDDFS